MADLLKGDGNVFGVDDGEKEQRGIWLREGVCGMSHFAGELRVIAIYDFLYFDYSFSMDSELFCPRMFYCIYAFTLVPLTAGSPAVCP